VAVDLKLQAIMKMPLSRRILLLAAVHVLFIVIFYFLLLSPKVGEIATQKSRLETVRKKVASTRVIAANIPKFKKEKEGLEVKLKKALSQLPNDKEIPNLIDNVSKAAKEAGLDILVFKPAAERPKGFYAEVPIKMKVKAEFESFYAFCQKVGGLSRIVNIENLSAAARQGAGGGTQLGVDFMVTTFRFIPEGKKNKKRPSKK